MCHVFPITDLPVELQDVILVHHTTFADRLALSRTNRGIRAMMPKPKSALHVLKERAHPLVNAIEADPTTALSTLENDGRVALAAPSARTGLCFYDIMDRSIDAFVKMAYAVSDDLSPTGMRFEKQSRTYTVRVASMERGTRAEVRLRVRDDSDGFQEDLALVVEGGR